MRTIAAKIVLWQATGRAHLFGELALFLSPFRIRLFGSLSSDPLAKDVNVWKEKKDGYQGRK